MMLVSARNRCWLNCLWVKIYKPLVNSGSDAWTLSLSLSSYRSSTAQVLSTRPLRVRIYFCLQVVTATQQGRLTATEQQSAIADQQTRPKSRKQRAAAATAHRAAYKRPHQSCRRYQVQRIQPTQPRSGRLHLHDACSVRLQQ